MATEIALALAIIHFFLTGGGLGGGQHGGYGALYCDCTRCPWNPCYEQIVGTDKWG